MAVRRGSFPVRGRRPRRVSQWLFGPDMQAIAFTVTGRSIWSTGISSGLNQTIVRIRGVLGITLTAGGLADGYFGACGIGLVAENAFAAGVGSTPTAFLDADWDGWIWHHFFDIRGFDADGPAPHQDVRIDSKAMRKWEGDEMTLFGSVDVVESGTAGVSFEADTRVLVKLP